LAVVGAGNFCFAVPKSSHGSESGAFFSGEKLEFVLGPILHGAVATAGISLMVATLVGSAYASLKAVRGDEGFITALMYAVAGVGIAAVVWVGVSMAVPDLAPLGVMAWFLDLFGGKGGVRGGSVVEQIITGITVCSFVLGVIVICWGGGRAAGLAMKGSEEWPKQLIFAICGFAICFAGCGVYYFSFAYIPSDFDSVNPGGSKPFDFSQLAN
jgi:hypothetical protein